MPPGSEQALWGCSGALHTCAAKVKYIYIYICMKCHGNLTEQASDNLCVSPGERGHQVVAAEPRGEDRAAEGAAAAGGVHTADVSVRGDPNPTVPAGICRDSIICIIDTILYTVYLLQCWKRVGIVPLQRTCCP